MSDDLRDLRPLPSQMLFIWQVFVENVGPFVQILHSPTMRKVMEEGWGRTGALDPSMEPLMFAISMAALNPLTEEEVQTTFPLKYGKEEPHLIYRLAGKSKLQPRKG